MLKIKDNVDLKELEKYGFIKDSHCPNKILPDYDYCYDFLRIDIYNKKIFISSGVDEVNGDEEIIKLYDLIKDDLVEKVKEKNNMISKDDLINKLKYISNNPLINGEYDEENYLFDDEAKLLLNYIENWNKIKDYIEIKRDEYSNEDNEWRFINE